VAAQVDIEVLARELQHDIRRCGRGRCGLAQERRERAALEARLRLQSQQIEDGRREIDERDVLGDDAAGGNPGPGDDQRYVHRRVEEVVAVAERPVLEEFLAVVGGDDDQRMLENAALLERVEEPAELFVHRRDLRVVHACQARDVLGLERRGIHDEAARPVVEARHVLAGDAGAKRASSGAGACNGTCGSMYWR
jgi:hypothetical protein